MLDEYDKTLYKRQDEYEAIKHSLKLKEHSDRKDLTYQTKDFNNNLLKVNSRVDLAPKIGLPEKVISGYNTLQKTDF